MRTLRDRTAKKLAIQQSDLLRCADREALRQKADLIKANLYRIQKGDRTVTVQDYYAEGCPDVTIELDPRKSPQENAAAQVEPVVYLQGQNIIREGERVQANQLAMLEALGLLDTASYDYDIYLGALLLIISVVWAVVAAVRLRRRERQSAEQSPESQQRQR